MRIAPAILTLIMPIDGGAAFAEGRPVSATIACDVDGKSTALIVAGERVDDPAEMAASGAIARIIPDKHARIVFTNLANTPYRCLGGVIYTLQSLGYSHLEFISEPPVVGDNR